MNRAVGSVVLAASLALVGCTAGEDSPPSSTTAQPAPPEAAITLSGAKAFYRTHDAAVAKARGAAYGPKHERRQLASVFRSPELDQSVLRSRLLQVEGKTQKVKPSTSVRQVYAPLTAAGPQAVVAAVSVSKKSWEGLRVLRRDGAGDDWRTALSVETSLTTLPEPAEPGALSASDRSRARSIVAKVIKFIDGGKASGFVAGAAVDRVRTFDTDEQAMVATKKTKLWGSANDGTEPGGPIVVTATADGLLVLAALETAVTVKPRFGGPISYRAPYDRLFGISGNRPSITNYYGVGLAITVPDTGKPIVVGAEAASIMPPARR